MRRSPLDRQAGLDPVGLAGVVVADIGVADVGQAPGREPGVPAGAVGAVHDDLRGLEAKNRAYYAMTAKGFRGPEIDGRAFWLPRLATRKRRDGILADAIGARLEIWFAMPGLGGRADVPTRPAKRPGIAITG